MPILRPAIEFNRESAASTPRHAGVFGLYDEQGVAVFFGVAKTSLREELTEQFASEGGESEAGDAPSLTVNWEVTPTPQQRCRDLIDEHIQTTGKPPVGNT